MSFIVESVAATEASEVLRARLAVRKNTLKAEDSKMGNAKVDVGVDAGVVAKKTETKETKVASGLQSQNKLASQLRKRGHIVEVDEKSTVPANVAPAVPQQPQQPQPQQPATIVITPLPASTQAQASPAITQAQAEPKTQSKTESKTETASAQTEAKVNITEVIGEYIQQLEAKMQAQMENLMNAIAQVKQAEKERNIGKVAKLLTQIQDLELAFAKAAAAEAAFQKKQNERVAENKKVVIQWIEDAKKAAAEQKAKIKAEVETQIEHIRPSLEQAEKTYKEKKLTAQREVAAAVQAIKNAVAATREHLKHQMKIEIALRYPKTAAAAGFFGDEKENSNNPAPQTEKSKPSFLQRNAAILEDKQPILVAMNTNKLKQQLSQLH